LSRYHSLFASIGQGFAVCEMLFNHNQPLDYRFLEVNRIFETMTGLAQVVGKTARQLVPNLEDIWFETYANVVLTGKAVRLEHPVEGMDHRWFEVNAFPVDAPQEHRFGILFTEISDRKYQEINNNFLVEIQKDLVRLADADQIMSVTGEKIRQFFGFSILVFVDIDMESDQAVTIYNARDHDVLDAVATHRLSDYWSTEHLEQLKAGQTIAVADTETDLKDRSAAYAAYQVRSIIAAPHLRDGRCKFLLSGSRRQLSNWRTDEIELIDELTARIYLRIERARAEASLQKINQRFESAMRAIDGIVFEWNLQTGQIYRSEGLFKLIGVRSGDALPTKQWWLDRIHPDDLDQLRLTIDILPPDSDRFQQEYRVRHADGRWIDVWERSYLQRNPEGEVICIIGFTADISDRKYAERRLRESERLYRAIGETIDYGIWINDPHGQNIYASPSFLQMVGITQAECAGLDWSKFLHPDERDRTVQAWLECVRTETNWYGEHRYLGVDGNWHSVLTRGIPVRNDQGKIICWAGINLDISELKQSEQLLRQSEERYRHLVELIPQLVWVADHEGTAIDVNQRWLDFTGLSTLEEAQSLGLKPFLHPDDLEIFRDLWQLVQQEGVPLQAEGRIKRHDGIYRWYLHQAVPIKDDQGQVVKWFGTGTDIEEQKQLEQQYTTLLQKVQERNQELDHFSHIVSHDLKAPLRAIANLSEWLEEDLLNKVPAENQLQLQLMRSRVYRMEALIDGLLSYARIAKEEIHSELVVVEELLAEIIDSLDPIHFTIEIVPPLPTFVTKRLLLNQVLTNLISNAIKHHHRQDGKIKITIQEHPEFYEFAITDDGRGIDPKHQARIFDIFQTLESQDKKQSSGIGLAIVKKIVESEGGTINLRSEIGQGSTFSFTWRK
jgi:PAS domain S-box-containing protein